MKRILLIFLFAFPLIAQNGALELDSTTVYRIPTAFIQSIDGGGNADSTQAYTIEFWLKYKSTAAGYTEKGWLMADTAASTVRYLQTSGQATNLVPKLAGPDAAGTTRGYSVDNFGTQAVWKHVAIVYDPADGFNRGYTDGVAASVGVNEIGVNFNLIGAKQTAPNTYDTFANVYIDELRIWTVARSQADIQANYQKELSGNESGLQFYYRFNAYLESSATANTLIKQQGNERYGAGPQITPYVAPSSRSYGGGYVAY